MKTNIYYFTGTGNSLRIAKDIKTELGDADLIQICKNNQNISEDDADKVGFVFPVYVRGLPHMVRDFAARLQIKRSRYIFAVANYGNYPALAFIQLNQILQQKGQKLSAAFGLAMPGNMWFMYYPHPKKDFADRINAQGQATLEIAQKIEALVETPINELIENREQEEERYRNFEPRSRARDFWVDDKCNGCGLCAKICPADNIKLVDERPVWQQECEFCLACIHWCPQTAIEYKQDSIGKERYHHPGIKVKELYQKQED